MEKLRIETKDFILEIENGGVFTGEGSLSAGTKKTINAITNKFHPSGMVKTNTMKES